MPDGSPVFRTLWRLEVVGLVAASWPVEAVDHLFDGQKWLLTPFFVVVAGGAYGVFAWLNTKPEAIPDSTS